MTIFGKAALAVAASAATLSWIGMSCAPAAAMEFASHRAIYELKLAQTRGNSSAMSARGRILYDFSGSSCEGYALQFRQVSELDNGEGKSTLSDLRSTSWDGEEIRFQIAELYQRSPDRLRGRAGRT